MVTARVAMMPLDQRRAGPGARLRPDDRLDSAASIG